MRQGCDKARRVEKFVGAIDNIDSAIVQKIPGNPRAVAPADLPTAEKKKPLKINGFRTLAEKGDSPQ